MEGLSTPDRAVEDRIRALPCWRGRIDIAPLKGGISNESYLVTDGAGRHVVRFGRDYPRQAVLAFFVAEKLFIWKAHLAVRHPFALPPCHILRNGATLLLCQ